MPLDSLFWNRWVWPEAEVAYSDIFLNRAYNFTVSRWYQASSLMLGMFEERFVQASTWHFKQSPSFAIIEIMMGAAFFIPFGMYKEPKIRALLLPSIAFISFCSYFSPKVLHPRFLQTFSIPKKDKEEKRHKKRQKEWKSEIYWYQNRERWEIHMNFKWSSVQDLKAMVVSLLPVLNIPAAVACSRMSGLHLAKIILEHKNLLKCARNRLKINRSFSLDQNYTYFTNNS